MLFGPVNKSLNKYRDIEEIYKNNIDDWLCNFYFSIRKKSNENKAKEKPKVTFPIFNEMKQRSKSPYCILL